VADIRNIPDVIVKRILQDHPSKFADGIYWYWNGVYWVPLTEKMETWWTRCCAPHDIYDVVPQPPVVKGGPTTFQRVPVEQSSTNFAKELFGYIRRSPEIEQLDFFRDAPPGVTVRNGFLHLRSDGQPELLPASPAFASRYYIDLEYAPDAICPYTREMLESYFVEDTDNDGPGKIQGILDFLAICLFGQANIDNRGLMLCAIGPREFGKTALLKNLVNAAFDMEPDKRGGMVLNQGMVSSVEPHLFHNENALMQLVGRMLNYVDELPKRAVKEVGIVKRVVSGEMVPVRSLYKDHATARMTCGHLFIGNDMPIFADSSGALQTRIMRIEFTHQYKRPRENSTDIAAKVKAERAGIINLLCKHYREMCAANSGQAAVRVPVSSLKYQDEATKDANTLAHWVEDSCTLSATHKTARKDLMDHFRSWSAGTGEGARMFVTADMLIEAIVKWNPEAKNSDLSCKVQLTPVEHILHRT
jgi:hypothetical protein